MTVVGAILIPLLGYALDHAPLPLGYQCVFILSFVGSLPNIYFFSRIRVPPNERPASDGVLRPLGQRLRESLAPFLQNRLFMRFNLATALFRICLSMPAGLYSLYWVNELRATDTWVGLRGMAGYAMLAVSYWAWGRLAHRMGHRRLLIITGVTLGLYPILTGLAQSVEWLMPAAMIWGMGVAGIDIGMVDLLLVSVPETHKPSFVAIANMLASAENFAGPLLGATLAPLIGIKAALLLSGALVMVSAIFFLFLPSREQEYAIHAGQTHAAQ
jgi:Na+/melibiose symporter-like transporter